MSEKMEVRNFVSPGHVYRVDRAKYEAMRDALLPLVPHEGPGLTPAELLAEVKPRLPADLFPGGAKAGWWMKCVQLDQEARGTITRATRPPVRLHKA